MSRSDRPGTSPDNRPAVGFVSLGCAKNLVDSQVMAGVLVSEDIRLAPAPEEADVVIVNTCAFVEEAREESLAHIESVCDLKRRGRCKAVLVAGCLPQRYRDELMEVLPEVDAFIGLDELESVAGIVRHLVEGESGVLAVSRSSRALFEQRVPGLVFSGGKYAYLKIAEGCDHPCTFCAIPAIRGRHRSRPIESIVAEAEHLLANGFRELDLISQDTTSYGRGGRSGGGLPELLTALAGIGGSFRIRLLYGYPSRVTDELLVTMAALPQVCHYLDIPIQHSHPDILRAMRRGGTARHIPRLIRRARAVMPDITLRTTCLVGFPGETEKHFRHLLDFVAETGFDHLGVFVFSPEQGTAAEHMPHRPRRATAERRREALLETQRANVDRKAAGLIGTTAEVLVEGVIASPRRAIGRTRRQAPEVDGETIVAGIPADLQAGDFLSVRYTGQSDYDMLAEPV